MKEKSDKERLMKICRASSSMPLVSPIVNVDGVPYLDGGLADSIPINRATKLGNKKVVLILTRNMKYRKKLMTRGEHRLYQSAYKKYPKLVESIRRRPIVYNRTDWIGWKVWKREEKFLCCVLRSNRYLGWKRTMIL